MRDEGAGHPCADRQYVVSITSLERSTSHQASLIARLAKNTTITPTPDEAANNRHRVEVRVYAGAMAVQDTWKGAIRALRVTAEQETAEQGM